MVLSGVDAVGTTTFLPLDALKYSKEGGFLDSLAQRVM